jgi:tetratricopeptide (TPR) repeat protein
MMLVTANDTTAAISHWINRSLELLWLLTVVLVPLVFLDPDSFLSEAVIAYVEVPKIALLRTLVGLMAILWLVEWGLTGQFPLISRFKGSGLRFQLRAWLAELAGWLRNQPTRWLILAVWFFLGTTLLSTVLSASFSVSLWGEVPGQDGFAAYTIITYVLLFGVITTHLKTRPQLWRLLAAIVVMGVMVAGYAVLQHYGHDFLGVLEATGGGRSRVTSTVGNAVFAAALMLMPIPISLMLATITLGKLTETTGAQKNVRPRMAVLAVLGLWVLVLTVQLLGIIFTFSRGPWLGTILALVGFMALAAILVRWRALVWAILALGLAGALTWVVVQWSGTVPTFSVGAWPGVILALAGLLALGVILRGSPALGRATTGPETLVSQTRLASVIKPHLLGWVSLTLGLAAAAALAAIVVLPSSNNETGASGSESSAATTTDYPAIDVQERFASITGGVFSGDFSNRGVMWKGSLLLMQDHPWFDFDSLSLPWLRPIVGYGPDLFRYAYLLVSVHHDASLIPAEPDHAHNFFLHQGAEQGILGLLSSLGIFVALFSVGGYQLIRGRKVYSGLHALVLTGLLATLAGRFLEQMVGIARVSDLTIFWALLAVFATLPTVMRSPDVAEEPAPLRQSPRATRSRDRRSFRSRPEPAGYDWQRFLRLAVVAWAIGGIIALTWIKTLNYPRAGLVAGEAVEHFQRADYQATLASLDRAIELAPDVPVYHMYKASAYAAYLQNRQVPPEPECSFEPNGTPYEVCLGQKIYLSNLAGVQQRPFYWRARLALANSALALGLESEAISGYQEVVSIVPASWPLYNRMAEAHLDIGQPAAALEVLEDSLAITRETPNSAQALNLQETAYQKLEEAEKSPPAPEVD